MSSRYGFVAMEFLIKMGDTGLLSSRRPAGHLRRWQRAVDRRDDRLQRVDRACQKGCLSCRARCLRWRAARRFSLRQLSLHRRIAPSPGSCIRPRYRPIPTRPKSGCTSSLLPPAWPRGRCRYRRVVRQPRGGGQGRPGDADRGPGPRPLILGRFLPLPAARRFPDRPRESTAGRPRRVKPSIPGHPNQARHEGTDGIERKARCGGALNPRVRERSEARISIASSSTGARGPSTR